MPYKQIQREPLGIRKLDVQKPRREMEKELSELVAWSAKWWFEHSEPTQENVQRFAEAMYARGWEHGVRVGAAATRDRVAESLENGRLVKRS
jgi:hypothetical protein